MLVNSAQVRNSTKLCSILARVGVEGIAQGIVIFFFEEIEIPFNVGTMVFDHFTDDKKK